MKGLAALGTAVIFCICSHLQAQPAAIDYLDISIGIFTSAPLTAANPQAPNAAPADSAAAVPDSVSSTEVRLAEQRYLPMYLRYRLEASERFGAVRVLPVLDNGAQLMLEGQIVQSDGSTLELAITARDSTGRLWLDRRYAGGAIASVSVTDDPLAQDDFAYLFADIVRDLIAALDQLSVEQREEIQTVALLRYGQGLAPQAFSNYLTPAPDGTFIVTRLPASNDPMLGRIAAIREREYLFIDVVDQEYQQFFGDIKPVYDMWRRFQREQVQSAATVAEREADAVSQFRRGSYYALQESYNNYRWAKVQELYLDELREGFANEVEPTEIELEDALYKLNGTLEQQYREWRSILAELFELETR